MKFLPVVAFLLPLSALACSVAGCLDHGMEVGRGFVVRIKHNGRPLEGVVVEVRGASERVLFAEKSALDGAVHLPDLSPGDYWLTAEFLGIGTAYQCFHIADKPSRNAKQSALYE
jgi:hypothetical protein